MRILGMLVFLALGTVSNPEYDSRERKLHMLSKVACSLLVAPEGVG